MMVNIPKQNDCSIVCPVASGNGRTFLFVFQRILNSTVKSPNVIFRGVKCWILEVGPVCNSKMNVYLVNAVSVNYQIDILDYISSVV